MPSNNIGRAGLHQRNNNSGTPGIRARWRTPKHGSPQLGLDVRFHDGQAWRFTTLPATLDGMTRAIELREHTLGEVLPINPRTALRLAKQAAGSAP